MLNCVSPRRSALAGGCALYPSERGADAWYPDILLDESNRPSVPLPAGLAQPLWITAEVGDAARPGNYTAAVRVRDAESGELIAEVRQHRRCADSWEALFCLN